jgi:hypothetical protein
MKKMPTVFFLFLLGLLMMGCGGGGNGADGGQVRVAVSPLTANVIAGQTQQFTATVTGALNSAVAWTVSCSTSSCGTIDGTGLYTAPALIPSDATVTVKATSQEDTNIVGTASVSQKAVTVSVSPNSSLTLISADTKQFTTTVGNAPGGHATATWSVSGGGTIDANGLYSAPAKVAADATVTVTVTSDFDNTKHASATVMLKAPVVTLSPGDMTLEGGGQQQFTPTVSYVPAGQNGVAWTLDGLGTISAGLYQAPGLIGTHQGAIIKAISVFDSTKSAQVVVTMDPIVIGVTPENVTKYPEETHQFTASVANHVNKAVTWSVTGTSCGGGACGTVDANGLYSAPSSISSEFTVNVVATSVADNSKTDAGIVNLKPITVTISPKTASVKVTTTQQFSASVQGGTNTNVTWSVSGTGCTGNTCGTINSTGLYTAPATVPIPPTVTVKAAAVADPTRFDTGTITVIYDPNVKLNGMYAFTFTGWDASGRPMDVIGSMVADGNGHLSGLIDMNGMGYANHNYHSINKALSGTYQVNAGDNRGEMVFTFTSSVGTETFNFRFAIDSTGSRGHFLLFESSGRYGSGIFKRQTSSDFSLAKLSGDYVMGVSGLSVSGDERNVAIARGHLDGTGGVSNTSVDISSTGGSTGHATYAGALTMSSTTGISSGRGTFAVSASGTNISFSFYMVNAGELFVMVSDTVGFDTPLLIGKILKQTGGPYSAASFNGAVVMYMTGLVQRVNYGEPTPTSVLIARYGVTNGYGNGSLYENWGGQLVDTGGSIYANIDSTGRATITSSNFSDSFVAYFVAPNTGFIMEYTTPSGGPMRFGFFEPQSNGPFAQTTLSGEFFGGATDPATSSVPYGNGIQIYDRNGGWSGTGNTIGPGSGQFPDQSVAGTYTITDSTTGAATWQGTYPGTYNKRFYVISPNKIAFVSAETAETYPILEVFEK